MNGGRPVAVVGPSERRDGAQEVEVSAGSPGSNVERWTAAGRPDRARRAKTRRAKARGLTGPHPQPGGKASGECFGPGKRADDARWQGPSLVRLNPKPTTLRHPCVWRAL